jgi:hypothetical protein
VSKEIQLLFNRHRVSVWGDENFGNGSGEVCKNCECIEMI